MTTDTHARTPITHTLHPDQWLHTPRRGKSPLRILMHIVILVIYLLYKYHSAHLRAHVVIMCMIICLCIIVYITDTHHSAHPFTRAFRIRIIRNRIFTPSSGTCTGTLSRVLRLNRLSHSPFVLFRTVAHVRSRNTAAILRAKNTFWYLHIFKCLFRPVTRCK